MARAETVRIAAIVVMAIGRIRLLPAAISASRVGIPVARHYRNCPEIDGNQGGEQTASRRKS
jgi:hypothetical protein